MKKDILMSLKRPEWHIRPKKRYLVSCYRVFENNKPKQMLLTRKETYPMTHIYSHIAQDYTSGKNIAPFQKRDGERLNLQGSL